MATECSWNDGSKTQYYVVILDQLQGRSRGLEWAPESRVRGPLTKGLQFQCHILSPIISMHVKYGVERVGVGWSEVELLQNRGI